MNLSRAVITYPDSLGQNITELHYVLRKYLRKAVGGVHILPFYPSSGDRGFASLTYDEVDPDFGTWKDIEKIGIENSPENRLILTWTDKQFRNRSQVQRFKVQRFEVQCKSQLLIRQT